MGNNERPHPFRKTSSTLHVPQPSPRSSLIGPPPPYFPAGNRGGGGPIFEILSSSS
jgi:hypothetical protein